MAFFALKMVFKEVLVESSNYVVSRPGMKGGRGRGRGKGGRGMIRGAKGRSRGRGRGDMGNDDDNNGDMDNGVRFYEPLPGPQSSAEAKSHSALMSFCCWLEAGWRRGSGSWEETSP